MASQGCFSNCRFLLAGATSTPDLGSAGYCYAGEQHRMQNAAGRAASFPELPLQSCCHQNTVNNWPQEPLLLLNPRSCLAQGPGSRAQKAAWSSRWSQGRGPADLLPSSGQTTALAVGAAPAPELAGLLLCSTLRDGAAQHRCAMPGVLAYWL